MNIVRHHNQRTVIHISTAGESVFARAFIVSRRFDGSYISHLAGIQELTREQAEQLIARASELQNHNIFIFDARIESSPVQVHSLFGSTLTLPSAEIVSEFIFIPSPYSSKIKFQDIIFSTQKTRAPNHC